MIKPIKQVIELLEENDAKLNEKQEALLAGAMAFWLDQTRLQEKQRCLKLCNEIKEINAGAFHLGIAQFDASGVARLCMKAIAEDMVSIHE